MVPLVGLFFDKFGWRMPFGMVSYVVQALINSINRGCFVHCRLRFNWAHYRPSDWTDCPFLIRFIDECYSLRWVYSDPGQRSIENGNSLWSMVIVCGL